MASIRENTTPTKYVCVASDLDKLLGAELKLEFWNLFYDVSGLDGGSNVDFAELPHNEKAWRMFYKDSNPVAFIKQRYGIDMQHPTVRDAVAFGLVKLDDETVSNCSEYTYGERVNFSRLEYDRYLLNKNYRVNLVDIEPVWSNVTYGYDDDSPTKRVRTVQKEYQGVRFSDTVLGFFQELLDNGNGEGTYVPFTNPNDVQVEFSLIPNTHSDFQPITFRSYYDMEYTKYVKKLRVYGIEAISTFALVDPKKDKTHTGWYRVKVQRKIGEDQYQYVVCDID